MFDKMAVYNSLPVWGQNLACCMEGKKIAHIRYGKLFWKLLEDYEQRAAWTYEHVCEYRDRRLRKMIRHCYDTVPYYTKLFDEGGINPERIKRLDDLTVLPVLSKETVNKNPKSFLSSAIPGNRMLTAHTSGTTGAGFVFKTTQRAQCEQWAVWWRYRKKLGIEFDTWCALFGGRSVVPARQDKPPFYRVNKPGKQIYFSIYHMRDDNMGYYVDALERYRLRWIHGYPSAIALLAGYMIDRNISLSYKVERVTTGAENLLEQQKAVIHAAFGVMPYQHYGMAEGIANISEDENHVFQLDEDYACTEFIPAPAGNMYRIIGTNLTNYAMPFVRYEAGDMARLSNGDRKTVSFIDGRKEDYLVLSNGTKIGRLDHIFKEMVNVKEAQIRQDAEGNISFFIVKGMRYADPDEVRLKHEIEERIGKEPYSIRYTENIEKSSSGKLRFVVQTGRKHSGSI